MPSTPTASSRSATDWSPKSPLLLSISAGIIVTRGATEDEDFGTDVVRQITRQPRALQIAGVAMAVLGLVPGLPHIPFLVVGAILYLASGRIEVPPPAPSRTRLASSRPDCAAPDTPQALAGEMRLERLELVFLISLPWRTQSEVAISSTGCAGCGGRLAVEKGFAIPTVRTRDSLNLLSSTYAVKVNGVEVARGHAPPGRMLAIGSGLEALPGDLTIEPVFGLPAKWIPAEARE